MRSEDFRGSAHVGVVKEDIQLVGMTEEDAEEGDDWLWPPLKGRRERRRSTTFSFMIMLRCQFQYFENLRRWCYSDSTICHLLKRLLLTFSSMTFLLRPPLSANRLRRKCRGERQKCRIAQQGSRWRRQVCRPSAAQRDLSARWETRARTRHHREATRRRRGHCCVASNQLGGAQLRERLQTRHHSEIFLGLFEGDVSHSGQ